MIRKGILLLLYVCRCTTRLLVGKIERKGEKDERDKNIQKERKFFGKRQLRRQRETIRLDDSFRDFCPGLPVCKLILQVLDLRLQILLVLQFALPALPRSERVLSALSTLR